MKKILFLLVLALSTVAITAHKAEAQTGKAFVFPLVAGDTLNTSNGTTNYDSVFKIIPATAGYSVLGIQVNVRVLSGTLAGKIYLFKSYDGAFYQLTDSVAYATPTAFLQLPIGTTKVATIEKVTVPGVYYMVATAQNTGTVSAVTTTMYTLRNYSVPKP